MLIKTCLNKTHSKVPESKNLSFSERYETRGRFILTAFDVTFENLNHILC